MSGIDTSLYYASLVARSLQNELSPEEQEILAAWRAKSPANEELFRQLSDPAYLKSELAYIESVSADEAWHQLRGKSGLPSVAPVRKSRMAWRIAAAVILLAGLAIGFTLLVQPKRSSSPTAQLPHSTEHIQPGGDRAVLTLSDGRQIILDSAGNGALAMEGSAQVIKLEDGRLAYTIAGNESGAVLYNTISTPRGGQYRITLSDGSRVWLNATSSLRYPAAFSGTERRVTITGEAYFEVAANPRQPFIVGIEGGAEVAVTGTRFNINAYPDETGVRTSLLEGKVSMAANGASVVLQPGEQARLNGSLQVVKNIDMDEVVAWKEGLFQFNRADIGTILRQVSRWYDVDIAYEGPVTTRTFSGIVSRDRNVSEVLKIMELAGVRFRIEGRKILVLRQ